MNEFITYTREKKHKQIFNRINENGAKNEMHDTKQKLMEFFLLYNQNRMIKTKNETNFVKNMNFVVNLLTSVIELNNLLRYTTLEYLNANDRNMAIITFYMSYIYRYIDENSFFSYKRYAHTRFAFTANKIVLLMCMGLSARVCVCGGETEGTDK